MKVQVMFKSVRPYTDKNTGEVKMWRELHVLHEEPNTPVEGEVGQKVEIYSGVKFDTTAINVGAFYEPKYEIKPSRRGNYAVLIGLDPAE